MQFILPCCLKPQRNFTQKIFDLQKLQEVEDPIMENKKVIPYQEIANKNFTRDGI